MGIFHSYVAVYRRVIQEIEQLSGESDMVTWGSPIFLGNFCLGTDQYLFGQILGNEYPNLVRAYREQGLITRSI
jgi:hypothetical protein